LKPDAVDRFADPEYGQDPEACENVPEDGPQPREHTRVRRVADETCTHAHTHA